MENIFDYLKKNDYPGRGIIVGRYNDNIVIAYFIMGRSENSRNRLFKYIDSCLYTKAFDESKIKDPSLIIYKAYAKYNNKYIVCNGDQTDTILDYLKKGESFNDALNTRCFEPDGPNYTPRISVMVEMNNNPTYKISILKNTLLDGKTCERLYYDYVSKNGIGHFISTYDHNGNPLPSFSNAPIEIEINEDICNFSYKLFNSLNDDNKISLFVKYININNSSEKYVILNKNK